MKKIFTLCISLFAASAAFAQISVGVKAGVGFANTDISVKEMSGVLSPGVKTGFYLGPTVDFGIGEMFAIRTELTYNLEGFRLNFTDFPAGEIISGIGGLDPGAGGGAGADPGTGGGIGSEILGNAKLNGSAHAHYHNLKLPVLAVFKPAGGLSIMAGPYVSYRVAVGTGFSGDLKTLVEAAQSASAAQDGVSVDYAGELKTSVKDSFSAFDFGLAFGVQYDLEMGVFIEARYTLGLLNTVKSDLNEGSSLTVRSKQSAIQIGMGVKF